MASVLPIDELLAKVPGDAPCGTFETEHDTQVSALLEGIKGVPAKTTMQDGETVVIREAVEPDWQLLRNSAEALFLGKPSALLSARGATSTVIEWKPVKHLGAAMVLALSALETEGVPGLADGLVLVDRLLTEHWDALHPQPARGPKDPFYARANLLSPLGAEFLDVGDSWRFVERLFAASLIESPRNGTLTVRDCLSTRTFKQKLDMPRGEPVRAEKVAAARLDFVKDLESRQSAVKTAIEAARRIEKTFKEKTPDAAALKLGHIIRVLEEAAAVLDGPSVESVTIGTGGPEQQTDGEVAVTTAVVPGVIATREQAVLMLSRVADYFALREPSSPIPQMLERARKLAGMNFLSLLEELELGQEAVPTYKKLTGVRDDITPVAAEGEGEVVAGEGETESTSQ